MTSSRTKASSAQRRHCDHLQELGGQRSVPRGGLGSWGRSFAGMSHAFKNAPTRISRRRVGQPSCEPRALRARAERGASNRGAPRPQGSLTGRPRNGGGSLAAGIATPRGGTLRVARGRFDAGASHRAKHVNGNADCESVLGACPAGFAPVVCIDASASFNEHRAPAPAAGLSRQRIPRMEKR